MDAGARNVLQKTVLLVLPRSDEALAVKDDDGTRVANDEEGYELKAEQIEMRLELQGLGGVGVEFFNARDDAASGIQTKLLQKIEGLRKQYATRITQLSGAVGRLKENRQDEQVRMVFEHVMRDLNSWLKHNKEVPTSDISVQQPLVSAIDNTQFASTVRASVHRLGEWYNLDYYHHLGRGVRMLAVTLIGTKIAGLKAIVNNLATNDDLSPAKEFLDGISNRVDVAVDEACKRIQAAGREAFIQFLSHEHEFWAQCERRWGGGKGYRSAISAMTERELETQSGEAEAVVQGLIILEWNQIVGEIEAVLQQQASSSSDSNAPQS